MKESLMSRTGLLIITYCEGCVRAVISNRFMFSSILAADAAMLPCQAQMRMPFCWHQRDLSIA